MTPLAQHLRKDETAVYRIIVQDKLDSRWAKTFPGCDITSSRILNGTTITLITGQMADQAALFGLLLKVRDLGLVLLRVELISPSFDLQESL